MVVLMLQGGRVGLAVTHQGGGEQLTRTPHVLLLILEDSQLFFGLNFVVMWIDYTGHSLFLLKPRAYRTLRNFSLSLSFFN